MKQFLFASMLFVFALSLVSAAEYDRILNEMNTIVSGNAAYAQMMDIGKNDQGNAIYGLRLENIGYAEDGKANHLVVGVHHGNERHGADVSLSFVKKVIAIYKNPSDPNYKTYSAGVYYVVPVLNIGGFNANRRYETNKNNKSIDPNRDYPDVCVQNTYFQLASTSNLAQFIERYNIVSSVTIHGYVGTFTYPWGMYTSNYKTLDHDFYNQVAAASVKANNYRIGTHGDIVYPASGSYEDWAYYKFGVWTMLMEMVSSPNIDKDANCLVIYYSLMPNSRSNKNQHTGTCTSTRGETESRP